MRSWNQVSRDRKGGNGKTTKAEGELQVEERFSAPKSEIVVLSRIMESPDVMGEVREILEPDDFSKDAGVEIYRAMCELWEERIPATFPILMDRLKDYADDLLDISKEGVEIIGFGPTFVTYHAGIVADFAEKRRYYRAAMNGLGKMMQEPGVKVQDVLSAMPSEILRTGVDNNAEGLDSLAHRVFDRLSKERSGEISRNVVSTGFADLDRLLQGGFDEGDLVTLAARSGIGKTTVAQSLLLSAARQGRAIFFSAEMSREQIMVRMAATASGIPLASIRTHTTSDEEHRILGSAMADLQQKAITIDDTANITSAQMLQRVQRIQAHEPVSLVVFDYLELIGGGGGKKNAFERLSDAVIELKAAAMRTGVPFVVISQVGRGVEQRPNKVPMLTDLRQTGMLEQASDKVLALYRHDYYVQRGMEEEDEGRAGKMEVYLQKSRNGPVGKVELGFDTGTGQLYDLVGDAKVYDDSNR